MSLDLAPFPDAERALCDLLADLGTTGTETYPNLQQELPYIRVHRTGGPRDRITDQADVEISVFHSDATTAKTVAGQTEARLATGPLLGTVPWQTAHGRIDSAATTTGPVMVPPTDSANLRQVTASYQVTARR